MSNRLRIAVGAAAVVVVALLAVTLLPKGPSVGAESPSPTSGPSATSTAEVLWVEGPLTPGTYATNPVFPISVAITVPDGWSADWVQSSVYVFGSEAAYLGFWIVEEAQRDPCGLGGVDNSPVGPTAADLAAALAGLPGFDTTGPVDTNIGGLDGAYVELIGPLAGCTDPELWRTPDRDCRCMESISERNRLWILDVDGSRLVVDVLPDGDAPTDSAALAELEAVIDSIQISP